MSKIFIAVICAVIGLTACAEAEGQTYYARQRIAGMVKPSVATRNPTSCARMVERDIYFHGFFVKQESYPEPLTSGEAKAKAIAMCNAESGVVGCSLIAMGNGRGWVAYAFRSGMMLRDQTNGVYGSLCTAN